MRVRGRKNSKSLLVSLAILAALLIGGASIAAVVIINSSQSGSAGEQHLPAEPATQAQPPGVEPELANASPALPFALTAQLTNPKYERRASTNTWQATIDADCETAATNVLTALQAEQWQLKETGYLDLFGNAWGCVTVKNDGSNQRVLTISIQPVAGQLRLNVVELLTPEPDSTNH
jgi:amino acid transporter